MRALAGVSITGRLTARQAVATIGQEVERVVSVRDMFHVARRVARLAALSAVAALVGGAALWGDAAAWAAAGPASASVATHHTAIHPTGGDASVVLDPLYSSADDFFRSARLHTIELTIDANDFARMPPANGHAGRGIGGGQANGADDSSGYTKVPAELRFDGQDMGQIAVRYKGNSSYRGARTDLKRSLKLEFAHGDTHHRFFGMREINLNNNAFDGSQLRETLAYEMFRAADVPAPRTAFARVYITVPGLHEHDYAGLFTVVEEVDQQFFEQRWGRKIGVLLKPEGLSGLPDLGQDWKPYETAYSSKLKARPADAQRLIGFVQFLDHTSNEQFASHLADYLDVDEFLRFLAVETLIVNSDSPLAMNHNYYLTVHPDSGKVVWVPWDMNMAFGGFRRGELDLSVFRPSAPGIFPLADRVLADPALSQRYRHEVQTLLDNVMTRAHMDAELRRLLTQIQVAALQDPAGGAGQFEMNFQAQPGRAHKGSGRAGAAVDDFDDDNFGGLGIHERIGPPLRAFIEQRIVAVREQLAGKRSGVPGRAGFGPGLGQ
ncbi:MAG TPA: CotH kinase family protein [Steroidobacteraceae bacterium]|nr:CotH kinase family protein [Steroidobacteraceae bacterium]